MKKENLITELESGFFINKLFRVFETDNKGLIIEVTWGSGDETGEYIKSLQELGEEDELIKECIIKSQNLADSIKIAIHKKYPEGNEDSQFKYNIEVADICKMTLFKDVNGFSSFYNYLKNKYKINGNFYAEDTNILISIGDLIRHFLKA
jgi:hypothetical protein